MTIVGLDLSTKTGFSVIKNGKLIDYGVIKVPAVSVHSVEDLNMLLRAKEVSDGVYKLLAKYQPDLIFVEQTNSGRFRSSQKQLEFIHFSFLDNCLNFQGNHENVRYIDTSMWRKKLNIRLTSDQKKHNKLVKNKLSRGKITSKHLAVSFVNQKFNLSLKLKDNDIADAICIAYVGLTDFSSKKTSQSLNSALSL